VAARTGGSGPGLASRFGLDELSFGRDQSGGAAVTLGRRFARNLYAAYERSLSGTVGTLFLFYDLTQRFTVRAQAGERTAIDLIYTLTYD
jgi:translocation and assembly module TamB